MKPCLVQYAVLAIVKTRIWKEPSASGAKFLEFSKNSCCGVSLINPAKCARLEVERQKKNPWNEKRTLLLNFVWKQSRL